MSPTNPNPVAIIASNLGYDVDIYDVYNPNASTQGILTYTKLATVPNGATAQQVQTIHYASQLQAMRTGSVTALNNNYYQQFPVAVLPVSPFAPSLAFTLTSDMQQGMEETFKFIKYAQANPSSQLATYFGTALGDKTSQKNAVNTFFQGTASFKQRTLTTWTAVFSWQAQFTNPWQGTYYLYSLDSSSTTGSSAPALVATLAVVASAQASSAVLTMAGTNNENTPVIMVGDSTMEEQNPGIGNLSVVLTPTWLNISQTSQSSGNTVTNNVIGAAFTGTINGMKVTGNLNQLAIPNPSDTSRNATDENSANSFTLSSMAQLVGMLTGIGMLYYMAKGQNQAKTQKENDVQKDGNSKPDTEKELNRVDVDYQAKDVPLVAAESERLGNSTVPKVTYAYKQVDQAADIQNKEAAVEKQETELEEISEEEPPSKTTVDAAGNLVTAQTDLETATNPATSATDRDAAMTDATTTLKNTSTELNTELHETGVQLPQDERNAQQDTEDALNKEQEEADAIEQNEKEQEQQDENGPD
ncbi:hypothetical protein P7C71_g6549, partial [Lecanoromycetidae sp. Uapishka_2]